MTAARRLVATLVLPAVSLVAACSEQAASVNTVPEAAPESSRYHAVVRRTAFGIPHIKANDFGSLGYGLGYAQAQDNLCVLLDDIITDRGERARYFGAEGSYTIAANGATANNVDSDFFWRFLVTPAAIARLKSVSSPDVLASTAGFKDGFNRYVREIGAGRHTGRHTACRDAAWLIELDDNDLYRRYLRLALLASSSVFVNDIATAQPPGGGAGALDASEPLIRDPAAMAQLLEEGHSALSFFTAERAFASNMYALGSEATSSGVPMVFGNPHFPWNGTERLYIFHASLPGKVNIMGSALYGVPAVLIGFNEFFAWSHTVSTAFRFTFYELTLMPGDPTQYLYEGQPRAMESVPLTIQVREADGSLSERSRTLYRSHYGPMTTLTVSQQGQRVNLFPWSATKAYTLRDANAENDRLLEQFFRWNQAQSLDEFVALHSSVLGIPWVNTVASGPEGKAYYGDVSVVPHVTDAKVRECSTSVQAQALAAAVPGLPLLDGSRAACEWGSDPDAPASGIFGPGNLPTLQRDDWVHNCNDSHWLTNPAQPLEGYNRIVGGERSERSLRTRLCILQVQRHLDEVAGNDVDADGDRRFSAAELQETVLSSAIYSAELARDDVVASLCPGGTVMTRNGPEDVSEACGVLAGWDLSANLTAVGGHVWREFFRLVNGVNQRWLTPFSAADAVNTPRGLNMAHPQVQEALGLAVRRVRNSGFAMDAPLGQMQHSSVPGGDVVPVFGGEGFEGAFTIASSGALHDKGYPVRHGNSYIQVVTWRRDGDGYTPEAHGFVTYSQSTDPASPHYLDFTRAYAEKRWHRFPFREAEIAAQSGGAIVLRE